MKPKSAKPTEDPKVKCRFDRMVLLSKIKPNPRNYNEHPPKQIELLVRVIQAQGWRNPIIVSKRSGFIVRGHGRYLAAKRAGWKEAPVEMQAYASDAEELHDMVADNKIAELSKENDELLQSILRDLGDEERSMSGLDSRDLNDILTRTFVEEKEPRSYGNDITDDVPKQKEAFIVPIALTRDQWRAWEKKKEQLGQKVCKTAFLKLAGITK